MRDPNKDSSIATGSVATNNPRLLTKDSVIDAAVSGTQGDLQRKRVTWKRVLYHPLTWLAVSLHVGLLVVPFNPAPPVSVEPEEETEEADEAIPIDLLNLSELATSAPPPPPDSPPPPANTPPAPAAPAAQPPAAQAPAPPVPDPAQSPAAQVPDPVQPTPDPAPPPPAYDPSGDQQLFVQNLGAIGLNTYDLSAIGLPTAREFKEPANAPFFLSGDQPVASAKSIQQIDKEPGDVYSQVTSSYASTGITFTQEPAYGGEELYHAVTPDNQTLMYFSLVRLKGSTLLVIWNEKPA